MIIISRQLPPTTTDVEKEKRKKGFCPEKPAFIY